LGPVVGDQVVGRILFWSFSRRMDARLSSRVIHTHEGRFKSGFAFAAETTREERVFGYTAEAAPAALRFRRRALPQTEHPRFCGGVIDVRRRSERLEV